ncbi:MBL fold metallo-hydrolase, partial [Vibrio diabolicus]|nr:MBL fold metallo-hydrolase [Vibrio diabolicus]
MLEIKSIPAFNDNYIWLIQNSDKRCAVVDPGDAKPVLEYLQANELTLEAILITHHHNDHIGGDFRSDFNYAPPQRSHWWR